MQEPQPCKRPDSNLPSRDLQHIHVKSWGLFGLAALLPFSATAALANPIQPARDGTGTVITINGQQFNISGGQLSGNGANLFHSFSQFGLSQGQIANFLSNPNIQNILSRVNSNNPSIINGLLQVSGGNSNLYLINPSGIIFGPNASLNVPAAFIATTANGIQFGDHWFSANGGNSFSALNGNPTSMAFAVNQPGSIINAGNLQVQPGQNLSLVGGTVVNVGTVSAPGGQVTIAAVPGQSAVRISQAGSVLSLELPLQPGNQPNQLQVPPLSLAELLTGGQAAGVNTGVALLPGGQVQVSGTPVPVAPGTAIVSGQVSVANPTGTGGTIQALGQNVALLGANLNASGQTGGGTVLVGGDYLGQGSTPTALRTFVDANSQIFADALLSGNGGKVIVWANDTTQFGGSIFARGGLLGGNGGFVETSGKNNLVVAPTGQVNASAVNGLSGQWLLDPSDITIVEDREGAGSILPSGIFDPPFSSTVRPSAIVTALNGGTNVTITTSSGTGGQGDITLIDSINQAGGGNASLTLTGRQFLRPGAATITMNSTGGLTFNLNAVASQASAPTSSIQAAHDAIGNVAGTRTINLFAPSPGAVTFSGATLNLNRNVTINGIGGASNVILSGENARRVVVLNNPGGSVTLNGLTITGGNAGSGAGGGIDNLGGNLTINNSVIQNNAGASAGGMAVQSGSVAIINSTIQNNTATSASTGAQGGGGVVILQGTLNLSNSTVSNNTAFGLGGGGIASQGFLFINGSMISGNTTSGFGGGIANGAIASITDSTISGNRAGSGGGVFNIGSLNISGSSITANTAGFGGGILNAGSISGFPSFPGAGNLAITNSTIASNSATAGNGGGILNVGAVSLTGSSLSNNVASGDGGGLANTTSLAIGETTLSGLGSTSLGASTINGNTASNGGGIAITGGSLTIISSTLSGNTSNSTSSSAQGGGGIVGALGTSISIGDSTINNNSSSGGGGGIGTAGSLGITNSTIRNNTARTVGGGIAISGTTDITGSTISGNTTSGNGGGIFNLGTLSITSNSIAGNTAADSGGGISNSGSLSILTSTISTNTSTSEGGGLANSGTANIVNSTINNNSSGNGNPERGGAGLFNSGTLTIFGSTITGNSSANFGGGIDNFGSLVITNSTISNNTASLFGGGMFSDRTVSMSGSLVTGNTAVSGSGGGISNVGLLSLNNNTITNNSAGTSGGGIFNSTSSGGGVGLTGDGTVNIAGGTITGNTAAGLENAIATTTGSTTNLSGTIPVTGSVLFDGLLNLQTDFTFTGVTTARFADITGAGLNLTASGHVIFNGNVNGNPNAALSVTTPGSILSSVTLPYFLYYGTVNLQAGQTINLPNYLIGATSNLSLAAPGNITTGPVANLAGILSVNSTAGNLLIGSIQIPGISQPTGGVYSQAGSVFLQAPAGTIRVTGTIPSVLAIAPGGATINTGIAAGASIFSGSPNTIVINLLNTPTRPFIVGDPTINGTAGRIQSPSFVINPGVSFANFFTTPDLSITVVLPEGQIVIPPREDNPCTLNPNSCLPEPPRQEEPTILPGYVTAFVTPPTPLALLERRNCLEFQQYFGEEFSRLVGQENPCERNVDLAALQGQLRTIEQESGQKSVIIYVSESAGVISVNAYFAQGQPVTRVITQASQVQLEALANELRDEVAPLTAGGSLDASALSTTSYLEASQKLYQLLIAPIAADLEAKGVQVLVFSMGRGLRGIPLAALHDGKQFLVEKYAIGTIPTLNLTQVSYAKNLRGGQMLAMGASEWESRGVRGVPDLPSVPTELRLVSRASGLTTQTFLNPQFTTGNLIRERGTNPFKVVHLATHGEFLPGQPTQSYIRFWDANVSLEQMRQLKLDAPSIELLTLSACKTAAGDEQAELGFAGMAIAAGVKTTLASLWYVSDVSTMALMSSFYNNLQTATTKAQALRQTQIAMLRGKVRIDGNQLLLDGQTIALTPEQSQQFNRQVTSLRVRDFSHPYFWSAFTMVGSPW